MEMTDKEKAKKFNRIMGELAVTIGVAMEFFENENIGGGLLVKCLDSIQGEIERLKRKGI